MRICRPLQGSAGAAGEVGAGGGVLFRWCFSILEEAAETEGGVFVWLFREDGEILRWLFRERRGGRGIFLESISLSLGCYGGERAEGNREELRDGAFERRLAERESKRGEENRERWFAFWRLLVRKQSGKLAGLVGIGGGLKAFTAEQSLTGKGSLRYECN